MRSQRLGLVAAIALASVVLGLTVAAIVYPSGLFTRPGPPAATGRTHLAPPMARIPAVRADAVRAGGARE